MENLEEKLSEEIYLNDLKFEICSVQIENWHATVQYKVVLNNVLSMIVTCSNDFFYPSFVEDVRIIDESTLFDYEKEMLYQWIERYDFTDLCKYIETKYDQDIQGAINDEIDGIVDRKRLDQDPYKYYGVSRKDFY
jgi:hypothetical protein